MARMTFDYDKSEGTLWVLQEYDRSEIPEVVADLRVMVEKNPLKMDADMSRQCLEMIDEMEALAATKQ